MSPIIILGLVLMWAVVLVPMWLRRHDEAEESRSADRFSTAMHSLARHDAKAGQRDVLMPHRSRAVDVHVSGASAPDARAARRRREMARRRARTLLGTALVALVLFIAAVATGSVALWLLQIGTDLAAVGFVVHLRRMAVLAAASRRAAARRAAAEPVEAEPAWDEGFTVYRPEPAVATTRVSRAPVATATVRAPVAAPAASAAAVAEQVFDQAALSDDELVVEELTVAIELPSGGRLVGGDGFFDQESDVDTAAGGGSFIETGARPARPAPAAAEAEAAEFAESLGGEPWEPVPVPKPTYAMKPAAPQRRARRSGEPILPPVETAEAIEAEIDGGDDLEAILDRRWAVND